MYHSKRVSVVIPTYNEADSIRQVIDGFFATEVVDEVIVVDNNARGSTKSEVAKTKARLVEEKLHQGYGHAIMRGLMEATGDLIVTVEADGTFDPRDIHKFLIYSDIFPVIFGTRTSRAAIWSGAFMPFPVRVGNWAMAKVVEVLHNGPTLTDVGCTYKLLDRKSLDAIKKHFPLSDGDGKFSPEMMIWLIRMEEKVIEIPIMYLPRVGESMYTGSIMKAAWLGLKMIPMIVAYRFRKI